MRSVSGLGTYVPHNLVHYFQKPTQMSVGDNQQINGATGFQAFQIFRRPVIVR